MAQILHIDTSPRSENSHSRKLAQDFINAWKIDRGDGIVTKRDLALNPVPYLDETWVKAKFTSPDRYTPELATAIKLSDRLIEEFLAVNCYVLSVPMYNFSIPAVLKSYIDHIVRPKRTFVIEDGQYKGLVTGKKMLVITARGSDFRPNSPFAPLDFQEPYLRAIFNFIGITDIEFVNANGLNTELREQSLSEARETLLAIASNW
ncbi:MAG: FMN-dependent NADH-azoreductase [Xenococcaceae cyanobacterium]